MADKKKICEAEENPSEQSELQEPAQQESLNRYVNPEEFFLESSQESLPSTSQPPPRWFTEMSSPTFNPAKLTVDEQVAYLTYKYSNMEVPVCYIDAMPRRPTPPQKPQPPVIRLHNRVPSLGSPERRKLHFKHPYPLPPSPAKCRPQSLPSPQHSFPPSWQAAQQYSPQTPPKPRSDQFNKMKVGEWLSVLKKHEKEEDENTKKEQEENTKKEQEEKTEKEQEKKTKKEQEEKAKMEEEENADVEGPENPDM